MNIHRIAPVLLAAAATAALAGCATTSEAEGERMDPAAYVGSTFTSSENGDPHITFNDDGTYKASDGCNGFGGEYEVDDGTITLKRFGLSTLRGCIGVDDWLRGADTVQVSDATLTVFNKQGDEIGTLSKN